MLKKIIYLVMFSFLLLTLKCTQEASVLNNTDLIFHDSYHLKIDTFSYTGTQGKRYFCQGDSIFYTTLPDTFDNCPLLRWDSLGIKILSTAIFTSPIVIKDNVIKNSSDIVWEWNSGMKYGDGRDGTVKYFEGKSVINKTVDYNNDPSPLKSGVYYWAVWGWNSEGTKILYSSRQMNFYVK
jgi:hypothetical protein